MSDLPKFQFKTMQSNTGEPKLRTWKNVPLQKDGKPLKAGDLKAGQIFLADPDTGEVTLP